MSHRTDDNRHTPDGRHPVEGLSGDDPRLTAYALGAMEPEEVEAFEALLDGHPDVGTLRAEIDAIRALASELEHDFAGAASGEGLDAHRRAAVLAGASGDDAASVAQAAGSAAPRGRSLGSPWAWGLAALAASLLIGIPLAALTPTIQERGRSAADPELSDEVGVTTAAIQGASGPEPLSGPEARGGRVLREKDGAAPGHTWERVFEQPAREPPAQPSGASAAPLPPSHVTPRLRPEPVPAEAPRSEGSVLTTGVAGGGGGGATPGGAVIKLEIDGKPVGGIRGDTGRAYNKQGASLGYAAGGTWVNWNAHTHGEQYVHPGIDGFLRVSKRGGHTSTFSVDVDTASYTNVRRMLHAGQRPHPAAIRIEEFVNYFDYGYAPPAEDAQQPFAQHIQVAACPWNPKHRLARIALKGKEIAREKRPASNLVFLVDVSGSMRGEDKLPLLQSALEMLAENLDARDRVSIVTYASSAALALESTTGDRRDVILGAIRSLKAGGSTNGAGGIQLAYAEAQKHFVKEGTNRVILCTDGDFNVGVSDGPGLTRLVQEKAKGGVYLSVLGFGTGNLQDGKMEAYSNAGNGNYAYIDSLREARRVLVEQMEGTLIAIAKDVKFQVWFNPKTVHAWRLLGYENRRLAARDFNDDSKDAGDIGAGHEVTALYEIVPTGVSVPGTVDPNPFVDGSAGKPEEPAAEPAKDEPRPKSDALFVWRLRWKQPDGDTSELVEQNVFDRGLDFEQADRDFQWAAGVTAFGMLLRHSPHRGQASFALVEELAAPAKGEDPHGRRAEFLGLVKKARGR